MKQYEIIEKSSLLLELSANASSVSVNEKNGNLFLWACVDENSRDVILCPVILEGSSDQLKNMQYLGTVFSEKEDLILKVFKGENDELPSDIGAEPKTD